jgi:hypothetical protein
MIRPCKLCGKAVDFSEPWCDHETMEESGWLDILDRRTVETAQAVIDAKDAPLTPQEVEDLAIQIIIDATVEQAAKELGWRASQDIKARMLKDLEEEAT